MWAGTASINAESGQPLRDNGVCLLNEAGLLFSLSEERLSQVKNDHNHAQSWRSGLSYLGISKSDVRRVGLSSCCDAPWSPKIIASDLEGVSRVNVPSHHYSHAVSAFILSPFDKALVFVADAGGNTFSDKWVNQWWKCPREQSSLWLGVNGEVILLDRQHFEQQSVGYGEWFRAVTYYLGWQSHTLSGNTMALSGFGTSAEISEDCLFLLEKRNPIANNPHEPIAMVENLLRRVGRADVKPRAESEAFSDVHKHLAAYLQRSMENDIVQHLVRKLEEFNCNRVCLSGGVAQNCLLNAKVAKSIGNENVYVSPFSSDVGQCVGNALFAMKMDVSAQNHIHVPNTFLGIDYREMQIESAVKTSGFIFRKLQDSEIAHSVSRAIAKGHIIAIFEGRSEFGPRALGHRSVIGSARIAEVHQRIKRGVKVRDDFMPLAPAIHHTLADELKGHVPLSHTMVFAPIIPDRWRSEFGHCLHVDSTARIQVVTTESRILYGVLNQLKINCNERVVINTSFNRRGKPIVQSPLDAITAFSEMDIDVLVMENYLLIKHEDNYALNG